jgi:hypothetical protein
MFELISILLFTLVLVLELLLVRDGDVADHPGSRATAMWRITPEAARRRLTQSEAHTRPSICGDNRSAQACRALG